MNFNRILLLLYRKFIYTLSSIIVYPRVKKCFNLYITDTLNVTCLLTDVISVNAYINNDFSTTQHVADSFLSTRIVINTVNLTANHGCDL